MELCWELLVLGKIKLLGPDSADNTLTPARIRMDDMDYMDYSAELRFACPMSFPKFRP